MSAQGFLDDDERSRELDLGLWRRILGHTRPYRRQLVGLASMGALAAAIEVALPLVTARMVDEAAARGPTRELAQHVAVYAALVCVFSAVIYVFIRFAGQIATGVAYDLRRKGFEKLQALTFAFFDVRPVGWLVTRLTSDVTKIANLIPWFTLDLVWGSLMVLGVTGAMLWLHAGLALWVLAIVPPLAGISLFFKGRLLESSRRIRRTGSQITASFNEALMGVRTTKALVREEAALGEFRGLTDAMRVYSMRNAIQQAIYLPLITGLGSVGVGLALWRGGAMLPDGLSLGTLIAFMQYAALFYMPIEEMAARFTDLQAAQAAAERLQGLLDEVPAVRDREGAGARDAERIEGIELRGVSFAYKPGEPVLRSVDLTVRAGETIALVGATGGGKSTIVSLIARYYEPTEGSVLVNGVDYRERSLRGWQSQFGVVLQSPHLFSGTVRENIRYGRLSATDEEVCAAARLVNAHGFVCELEGGYDAEVGECGSRLSTGQRQLLSLARAVLADPQVFVMDEATSSIDTETERLIQDAIDRVLKDRTAFVIAHRLSTIRSADRILVIDGGRIAEEGTHEELLARGGRYFELCSRQLEESVLAGAA